VTLLIPYYATPENRLTFLETFEDQLDELFQDEQAETEQLLQFFVDMQIEFMSYENWVKLTPTERNNNKISALTHHAALNLLEKKEYAAIDRLLSEKTGVGLIDIVNIYDEILIDFKQHVEFEQIYENVQMALDAYSLQWGGRSAAIHHPTFQLSFVTDKIVIEPSLHFSHDKIDDSLMTIVT